MAEINIDSCKKEMLVDIIGILYRKFKERFPNELINFTEVKHGKWVNGECSECGGDAPFWPMATTYYRSNFCPNCGARMVEHEHNLS